MRRLLRSSSSRFGRRIADYSYPQLRDERPRVTHREDEATLLLLDTEEREAPGPEPVRRSA